MNYYYYADAGEATQWTQRGRNPKRPQAAAKLQNRASPTAA